MSDLQKQLFPGRILAEQSDDPKTLELVCNSDLNWIEAKDGEKKIPTFTMVAYTGGKMRPAGFSRDVVIDLEGVSFQPSLAIFRGHDADKLVGHGTGEVSGGQIVASGVVSAENEHSKEVVAASKNGFPWQTSVGASVEEYEFLDEDEYATVNGKRVDGPVLIARKTMVDEISFVPRGADRRTSARVAAKSANSKEKTMNEFQKWLDSMGLVEAELSDDQATKLKAKYEAEKEPQGPEKPPVVRAKRTTHGSEFDKTAEEARKERERIEEIGRLGASAIKQYPEQVDEITELVQAAREDTSCEPQRFELELLRSTRPMGPPNVHTSRSGNELTERVIEASICKSLGLQKLDEHYDDKTLTASDRHFRHGIGLQELLIYAAEAHGQKFRSASNTEPLLRAAFGQNRLEASGFSTFSLSGILSNTMNKMLVDYFNAVESTWRDIASITPVRDFKTITHYALTGSGGYEKVGPGGEIKHGTLGEETYTNRAETYGKMLGITRQDIINDDLGAFQRVPRRLGRDAALQVNLVFWTEFMANSSFFTSGRGNFDDGASDTLVDITGLTNATTLFWNQTDPDGNPLGVSPALMLVPNALQAKANQLMNSTEVRDTTANTNYGVANPFAGMFRVVRSSYLSNSSITGNSALAWYLLADPMDLPVIDVAFLNGRDVPFIESADADFNTLGIQVRSYHDFGVSKQEYRAGVKMKGEA